MDKIRGKIAILNKQLSQSANGRTDVDTSGENTSKNRGLLEIELRSYQLKGVDWLISRFTAGHGCILADEMGLGKTCQTLAFLLHVHGSCPSGSHHRPSLILCPLSVINNWTSELTRFAPSLSYVAYVGSQKSRERLQSEILERDNLTVILTSYELCMRDAGFLGQFNYQVLVVDEAHRLKNRSSLLHQSLLEMRFDHRLLLTGTPIQNNLLELYALLCFVAPSIFRYKYVDDFVNTYADLSTAPISNDIASVLEPFILRRLKSDVLKDLPKKSEVVLYHGLSAVQKCYYKAILRKDVDAFDSGLAGGRPNKTRLVNILMQLRKCVAHPYLFDGVEPEPFELGEHLVTASDKLVVVNELLSYLRPLGHKVLIFSQMTRVLDILQDYLGYRDYPYERLDGSVRAEERYLAINEFNNNADTFVFLLSTKAGGQGLNLTTADTVIFYDSDFNPQNDLQAMARAHRIGQQRHVKVIRLVGRSTVEEMILRRAERKLQLTHNVMSSTTDDNDDSMKTEDIIKFGLDRLFETDDSSVESRDFAAILGPTVDGRWQLLDSTSDTVESSDNAASSSADDVNNMYMFEGRDYSKEPSAADCEAFQQLINAVKTARLDAANEAGRLRRSKSSTLASVELLRPPRTQLTAEQLDQRRERIAEFAALRAKREQEEEMRRAEAKRNKLAKVWADNDYKSCNLPAPRRNDDDDNDDGVIDDDDVDDDVTRRNINYVIGDVLQPQQTGNTDAVIVHCVDDGGHWGRGGLFTHIDSLTSLPRRQYTLAGKMKDLSLGDVHVVPMDDIRSRQTGKDRMALVVAQHRSRSNALSGLQLTALSVALCKLSQFARDNKATVHMPRIGHNTPGFNWYATERMIRKHLSLRGIPTYVYYFPRQRHSAPIKRASSDSAPHVHSDAKRHKPTPLPDLMTGIAVHFHNVTPPSLVAKLARRVIAYNGDVHDTVEPSTTHIVVDDSHRDDEFSVTSLQNGVDSNERKIVTVDWLKTRLTARH